MIRTAAALAVLLCATAAQAACNLGPAPVVYRGSQVAALDQQDNPALYAQRLADEDLPEKVAAREDYFRRAAACREQTWARTFVSTCGHLREQATRLKASQFGDPNRKGTMAFSLRECDTQAPRAEAILAGL